MRLFSVERDANNQTVAATEPFPAPPERRSSRGLLPWQGGRHGSILSRDPSTGKWSPRLGLILALRFWVAPGLAT
jgi:hypothetical protein